MFLRNNLREPVAISVLSLLMYAASFSSSYFFLVLHQCQAQLLHPQDMATGNWKLSIKRRDSSLFESMIFPKQIELEKNIDINGTINPEEETTAQPHQSSTTAAAAAAASSPVTSNQKFELRRRMECNLFLDDDGTFTLMPPLLHPSIQSFQDQEVKRQPLRGYWHLKPNPYCVTDRQYDELILESIPKVRVFENGSLNDAEKGKEKDEYHSGAEKITIEMSCNVWGRFGSNAIRRLMGRPTGKSAGRLTHGKLSIVKVTSDSLDESTCVGKIRRVLCATFRARHE